MAYRLIIISAYIDIGPVYGSLKLLRYYLVQYFIAYRSAENLGLIHCVTLE